MPVPDWPTNAKVYKIWWKSCADVYVGSTRKPLLSQRMAGHRWDAKRGKTALVHAAIRKNGCFEYDLLETVFCQNFDEARTHERRWAESLGANLNGQRPIITKEENKARQKEYKKKYLAKPEFKAKQKEYKKKYRNTPENKAKIKARVKAYNKEYQAKPEIKAKRKVALKAWRDKNLEEKRFPCEVCQYYALHKSNLKIHQKSKRHLARLNRQNEI